MEASKTAPRRRILALAAILLVFGVGCLALPTGFLATSTPTLAPTLPPIITPILPATELPIPPTATLPPLFPTATTGPGLNADGPWLLVETDQGLWAANDDGSGLTQITTVDYWHGNLQWAIQPGGHEIAYITPGDYSFKNLALHLVSLPDGKTSKLIDLTSPLTEPSSNSGPGDPGFEALRAIGEQRSFAWSPDGTKLAFAGAMDGPTAAMYIFDELSTKITRVSNNEFNNFSPSWSPDGQHLVYLEAKGFGTGAGMSMAGVWVANGDGSDAKGLYRTDSSGENIDGWLDNTTVLVDTWTVFCGPSSLRLVNVVTEISSMLNLECITSATASGLRQLGMYANDSGLYMISAEDQTPKKVDDTPKGMIKPWGPDDQVFTVRFQDASLATFGTSEFDHQVSPIKAPPHSSMLPFDQTDVSMWGAIWGWTSQIPAETGVWITGPGIELGRIFENAARFPTWSPHNTLFFFAPLEGGYDLYRATFDTHYTDLHAIDHMDADIIGVVWLGVK